MTRNWLFITGLILSAGLVQAACGIDDVGPQTANRQEALSTSIPAAQLAEDLPGCLEALSRDDGKIRDWNAVRVDTIAETPDLAVLVVDGRQMCVDRTDELEEWVQTGVWPSIDSDSANAQQPIPRDMGDVGHENVGDFTLRQQATRSTGGDDDPREKSVQDSNPLPPYPNPMAFRR